MNTRVHRKIKITGDETSGDNTEYTTLNFSGHPEYMVNWIKMNKLHTAKNSDYSHGNDPLANFKMSEKIGILPSMGIAIRLQDKFARYQNLLLKESAAVLTESIADTLLDIANYSLLYLAAVADEKENLDKNPKAES